MLVYFNPRSPSGLRLRIIIKFISWEKFQSTQPEWAATGKFHCFTNPKTRFQSTQPEWAATIVNNAFEEYKKFQSTQPEWAATEKRRRLFQPRCRFQSTQPEWAATDVTAIQYNTHYISIHAARVGCDWQAEYEAGQLYAFQSTQPEWAATGLKRMTARAQIFQSTQPEWAAT